MLRCLLVSILMSTKYRGLLTLSPRSPDGDVILPCVKLSKPVLPSFFSNSNLTRLCEKSILFKLWQLFQFNLDKIYIVIHQTFSSKIVSKDQSLPKGQWMPMHPPDNEEVEDKNSWKKRTWSVLTVNVCWGKIKLMWQQVHTQKL